MKFFSPLTIYFGIKINEMNWSAFDKNKVVAQDNVTKLSKYILNLSLIIFHKPIILDIYRIVCFNFVPFSY